jgi:hypothetical protein
VELETLQALLQVKVIMVVDGKSYIQIMLGGGGGGATAVGQNGIASWFSIRW